MLELLTETYNPGFGQPIDLDRLGVKQGDVPTGTTEVAKDRSFWNDSIYKSLPSCHAAIFQIYSTLIAHLFVR